MTAYTEARKKIERAIRAIGYATDINGLGKAGRHPDVSAMCNARDQPRRLAARDAAWVSGEYRRAA